jgi:D-beta-D-heptose 7-phosphate kinase/D-beta-D-heptose 1-phosphate adenosyltransferase
MTRRLEETLGKIGSPRILVAGDLMLDRYVWGDVRRISPEAPVPVLKVRNEENKLGGAGNVARNLVTLGAQVSCCGIVGNDYHGNLVLEELRKTGVDHSGAVTVDDRPTIVKTRMIAHAQQMVRVDREDSDGIDGETENAVLAFLATAIPEHDLVIVSDYDKGLMSATIAKEIVALARRHEKNVLVDSKADDLSKYSGATTITPNRREAERITGTVIADPEAIEQAAQQLLMDYDLDFATITLDTDGIAVCDGEGCEVLPTEPIEVYDTTGAGDMVLSVMGLTLAAGFASRDAARLANVAAGIEVSRVGVSPLTRKEIADRLTEQQISPSKKIKTLPELLKIIEEAKRKRRVIVFTNGCFDVLHIGHIKYLQYARAQGDLLVVGVNTDASVTRLKGPNRPILKQMERSQILAAIEWIDYIVFFDEDSPMELLKAIKPDVLVKGAEYSKEQVVGADFVESYGGKIRLAPMVEGISTSNIVKVILDRYRNSDS